MTGTTDSCRVSSRAEIAALAFAAVFPSAATWLYLVVLAAHPSNAVQAAYLAEKLLQFAFPLVWVAIVQRQKVQFPIARTAGVKEGLVLGIAVMVATLCIYFFWFKPAHYLGGAAALITAKAAALGMGSPARYLVGAALLSSVHALLEEYYWRWFLFGGLRRYVPWTAAAVISSLAFAAHHVILLASFFGGLTLPAVLFSVCVAVGGAAWATLYDRSKSLLGPWLSHALIDTAIFMVGYDWIFHS